MSVIGSIIVFVITLNLLKGYQEDFLTPGISPLFANSLKHILHSPNALIKPCRLPHLKQRRIFLDGYLGFFFAFEAPKPAIDICMICHRLESPSVRMLITPSF